MKERGRKTGTDPMVAAGLAGVADSFMEPLTWFGAAIGIIIGVGALFKWPRFWEKVKHIVKPV